MGEYVRSNYINEIIDPLILLYDKVIIKDKALFLQNPEKIDNFKIYSKNEWIIPISGFAAYIGMGIPWRDMEKLKSFSKGSIAHDEILDLNTWFNVSKVLSTELYTKLSNNSSRKDFLNLCENIVRASDFPYNSTEVHRTFYQLLEFYFLDQIMVSQLNCPSLIQDHQKLISEVYLDQMIINQNKHINHEVEIFKSFLKNLSIDIPLNPDIDELKHFRNEKISREVRTLLHEITERNRSSTDLDKVNDLLWHFEHKINEFNDGVNSFCNVRTGILTGIVSTVGGLIGGTPGAVIGGLGATTSMFIGNSLFKRYYIKNNKDWSYFLWKWKQRS